MDRLKFATRTTAGRGRGRCRGELLATGQGAYIRREKRERKAAEGRQCEWKRAISRSEGGRVSEQVIMKSTAAAGETVQPKIKEESMESAVTVIEAVQLKIEEIIKVAMSNFLSPNSLKSLLETPRYQNRFSSGTVAWYCSGTLLSEWERAANMIPATAQSIWNRMDRDCRERMMDLVMLHDLEIEPADELQMVIIIFIGAVLFMYDRNRIFGQLGYFIYNLIRPAYSRLFHISQRSSATLYWSDFTPDTAINGPFCLLHGVQLPRGGY